MSDESRPAWSAGFVAGVFGGLVMVLAQGIARLGARVPMFPDLFEDLVTRAIPAAVFSRVLDTLRFQAKPLLFVGLLLAQIAIAGLIGLAFASVWGRRLSSDRRWDGWRGGVSVGLGVWALTAVVLLPIAGQGMFGSATAEGPIGLNIALIAGFVLYGLTLAGGYRVLATNSSLARSGATAGTTDAVRSPERRRLLGGVAVGAVAVLAAGTTYRIVNPTSFDASASGATAAPAGATPPTPNPIPTVAAGVAAPATPSVVTAATPASTGVAAPISQPASLANGSATPASPATSADWTIKGLSSDVTSTADFYAVSKNFFSDPTVDSARWTLQVTGEVANPYTLTYNKLLQLPPIERYQTLMCISNEVGGDLIGNAKWRGTSLRDIIMAAQPRPGVVKVVFTAQDGYQDSVTFDRALLDQNILAHTMNGEQLNAKHGMPARLLIPGIYGMKNVKWITKIEMMTTDFKGYWQTRGWSDDAYINTMSRIDTPVEGNAKLQAGKNEIAGIAFGGEKGIGKVEVSVDGGKNWSDAILKEPLGTFSWRLWRHDWDAKTGSYVIMVRATDGKGELQQRALADTLPNGATGWHSISVTVA